MKEDEQAQLLSNIQQVRQEISRRKRYNSQDQGNFQLKGLQSPEQHLDSPKKEKTLIRANSASKLNLPEAYQKQKIPLNRRIGFEKPQKVQGKNMPSYKLDAAELLIDRMKKISYLVSIKQKIQTSKTEQFIQQLFKKDENQNLNSKLDVQKLNAHFSKAKRELLNNKLKKSSEANSLAELQKLIEFKQKELQNASQSNSFKNLQSPNQLSQQKSTKTAQYQLREQMQSPSSLIYNKKMENILTTKTQPTGLPPSMNNSYLKQRVNNQPKIQDLTKPDLRIQYNDQQQNAYKPNKSKRQNPDWNSSGESQKLQDLDWQNYQFKIITFFTEISQIFRKSQKKTLLHS